MVERQETMNPWLEVADLALAVAGGVLPRERAAGVATPAQLAELGRYVVGCDFTPEPERDGAGWRLKLWACRIDRGGEEEDGFLTLSLGKSLDAWGVRSIRFEPRRP